LVCPNNELPITVKVITSNVILSLIKIPLFIMIDLFGFNKF
jgi:hypothetical protein